MTVEIVSFFLLGMLECIELGAPLGAPDGYALGARLEAQPMVIR